MMVQRGFTLVELTLYMSLASIIVVGIGALMVTTNQTYLRTTSDTALQHDVDVAHSIIRHHARQAAAFTAPSAGQTTNTLQMSGPSGTIVFSINSGALRLQINGGAQQRINSTDTNVTAFSVQNAGVANYASMRLQITLQSTTQQFGQPRSETYYFSVSERTIQ